MTNDIPPRPSDPIGSAFWDLMYGPVTQNTPLGGVVQQINAVKEDLRSVITVAKSIDEMNKTLKESNNTLRETNNTLKALAERLK